MNCSCLCSCLGIAAKAKHGEGGNLGIPTSSSQNKSDAQHLNTVGQSIDTSHFRIKRRTAGVAVGEDPVCYVDPSICPSCSRFLRDFLEIDTWNTEHDVSRWEPRAFPKRSLPDEVAVRWVFRRYNSFQELETSAAFGCSLCKEALRVTDIQQSGVIVFTSGELLEYVGGVNLPPDSTWGTDFQIHALDKLDAAPRLYPIDEGREYNVVVAEQGNASLGPPGRQDSGHLSYPSDDAGSDKCFAKLFEWSANCVNYHPNCPRPKLPLPTRLLDVTPDGRWDSYIVLVESITLSPVAADTRYLTLSYCWGKSRNYRTTKANIEEHKKAIIIDELPAVLRDSVKITRKCGFKYLWIDAICIIQDDGNDWEVEAAKMGNVYAGSTFTISALSSADCEKPILGDRGLSIFAVGGILSPDLSPISDRRLWIRSAVKDLPGAFASQPLATRAWCYQERQLSAGIIHYGRSQLIWECNTCHLESETGSSFGYSPEFQIMARVSDIGPTVSGFDLWNCLVVNYSQLDITYASDRVAAMSGVAARFRENGQFFKGRYAAGLWEDDLVCQLLWSVNHWAEKRRVVRVATCSNFPTWSWASVNCEILGFGLRKDREAALEGRPRFRFNDAADEPRSLGIGKTVNKCEIVLEGYIQEVESLLIHQNGHPFELNRTSPKVVDGFWSWDRQPFKTTSQLYCLRMIHQTSSKPSVIEYLVLEKESNGSSKHSSNDPTTIDYQLYKRVGILTLTEQEIKHFQEPWPDVCFDNGSALLSKGRWEYVILV